MNRKPHQPKRKDLALKGARPPCDLEFPIDPDFLSLSPRLDPQLMLQRIAESMPWRNSRPGEAERRLAMKVDVEFIL